MQLTICLVATNRSLRCNSKTAKIYTWLSDVYKNAPNGLYFIVIQWRYNSSANVWEWHFVQHSQKIKDIGPVAVASCFIQSSQRLLHEGDLRRCYRNSGSVTYVSTLPSPSSSAPFWVPWQPSGCLASHPSCKVSAHLKQMCENGTSCNILIIYIGCQTKVIWGVALEIRAGVTH